MRRACICSARTRASVDLPTRIGPSITIYRGDLNLGPVTARDYSKVVRNARDTAAGTFVNESPPNEVAIWLLEPRGCGRSPAARDRSYDLSERVYIARVDHLRGRGQSSHSAQMPSRRCLLP